MTEKGLRVKKRIRVLTVANIALVALVVVLSLGLLGKNKELQNTADTLDKVTEQRDNIQHNFDVYYMEYWKLFNKLDSTTY